MTPRGPFALLREAEEADEVLLLTYTASLEFFERFGLGEARGLQAATTVISDAAMVTLDPLTVRGAGVRYVEARAVCPGATAFHPKLLVIAGRAACTIAVGSGNLTLAGWHGNEELWTVAHADTERGPGLVRGVSRFLRALADGRVQLSVEAPGVLRRVAELLDGMAADEPGPELVSSLFGPIIDQLPTGPVDELVVYAPFFDSGLDALDALHARLEPARTTVFVQPQTSVDGGRLQAWLQRHTAELAWCPDEPYRHGKLVSWSRDGVWEALTGSPNLSAPALLNELGGGRRANCELGTITRTEGSLAPPEAPAPAEGIAALTFSSDPADAPRPGLLLLGATLIDGLELNLRLAHELPAPVRVQAYDADHDWVTVPGVPALVAGLRDHRLPAVGFAAGEALRLLGPEGASNEVFVSDPARARRRPLKRLGPESGTPVALLLEGRLGVLYELAEVLRPALLQLGATVPHAGATPKGTTASDEASDDRVKPTPGQTLADYLAACAAVIDETALNWALVLPTLPGLGGDDAFDSKSGLLTSETGDDAADAGRDDGQAPPPEFAEAVRQASVVRRRQLRRFCEGALDRAVAWPPAMRAYLARLVLNAVAADLWDDEDRGPILAELVGVLVADGDEPAAPERAAVASHLAVTVALLHADVRRLSVNDEPTLRFKRAAAASRDALDDLDPVRLDTLVTELGEAFGDASTGERVFDLAVEIQAPAAGIAAAIALLRDEDDVAAHDEDGVLIVDDPLPSVSERALLRIVGLVDEPEVAVRGHVAAGRDVICVWQAPLLVFAHRTPAGLSGRAYRLTGTTPAVLAAGWNVGQSVRDNLPKPIADWLPGRRPPAAIATVLDSVETTDGAGPGAA